MGMFVLSLLNAMMALLVVIKGEELASAVSSSPSPTRNSTKKLFESTTAISTKVDVMPTPGLETTSGNTAYYPTNTAQIQNFQNKASITILWQNAVNQSLTADVLLQEPSSTDLFLESPNTLVGQVSDENRIGTSSSLITSFQLPASQVKPLSSSPPIPTDSSNSAVDVKIPPSSTRSTATFFNSRTSFQETRQDWKSKSNTTFSLRHMETLTGSTGSPLGESSPTHMQSTPDVSSAPSHATAISMEYSSSLHGVKHTLFSSFDVLLSKNKESLIEHVTILSSSPSPALLTSSTLTLTSTSTSSSLSPSLASQSPPPSPSSSSSTSTSSTATSTATLTSPSSSSFSSSSLTSPISTSKSTSSLSPPSSSSSLSLPATSTSTLLSSPLTPTSSSSSSSLTSSTIATLTLSSSSSSPSLSSTSISMSTSSSSLSSSSSPSILKSMLTPSSSPSSSLSSSTTSTLSSSSSSPSSSLSSSTSTLTSRSSSSSSSSSTTTSPSPSPSPSLSQSQSRSLSLLLSLSPSLPPSPSLPSQSPFSFQVPTSQIKPSSSLLPFLARSPNSLTVARRASSSITSTDSLFYSRTSSTVSFSIYPRETASVTDVRAPENPTTLQPSEKPQLSTSRKPAEAFDTWEATLTIENMEFTSELTNSSLKPFKDLASDLKVLLSSIFEEIPGFLFIEIDSFESGSIKCSFSIHTKVGSSATAKEFKEALTDAANTGKTGNYHITNVEVKDNVQAVKGKPQDKRGKRFHPLKVIGFTIFAGGLIVLIVLLIVKAIRKRRRRQREGFLKTGDVYPLNEFDLTVNTDGKERKPTLQKMMMSDNEADGELDEDANEITPFYKPGYVQA